MQSQPSKLYSGAPGFGEGEVWGEQNGDTQSLRVEQGLRRGIHISALAPLRGLQRDVSRGPPCLFLHFIRESQELNPHGFGCLGHRNATWVKCLLPAFQLESSTPFLELPEPLICASASKTLVVANLVTWVVVVLLVSRA